MDQPVLSGPTVTLRPLAIADAGALAAAAAESRQHYVYTRVPDGIGEAERYIAAALRDAGNLCTTASRKSGSRTPRRCMPCAAPRR